MRYSVCVGGVALVGRVPIYLTLRSTSSQARGKVRKTWFCAVGMVTKTFANPGGQPVICNYSSNGQKIDDNSFLA